MKQLLKRGALVPVGWLSIPVYFAIEAFIRLLNLGRAAPLDGELRDAMATSGVRADLDRVELAAPARLPIKHSAITLGRTIFIKYRPEISNVGHLHLLAHELEHVRQCEELGRLGMAMAYGRGWVDGFSYQNHHMEIAARASADEALPKLRARPPKA